MLGDWKDLRILLIHPVNWVNWHDAREYCTWLDQELRISPDTPTFLAELGDRLSPFLLCFRI